jgi:hypothetical protein
VGTEGVEVGRDEKERRPISNGLERVGADSTARFIAIGSGQVKQFDQQSKKRKKAAVLSYAKLRGRNGLYIKQQRLGAV